MNRGLVVPHSGTARHANAIERMCSVLCATMSVLPSVLLWDGHVATPVDEQGQLAEEPHTRSGLVVSGEELRDYASSNFGMAAGEHTRRPHGLYPKEPMISEGSAPLGFPALGAFFSQEGMFHVEHTFARAK
jgi:hypothetical protein